MKAYIFAFPIILHLSCSQQKTPDNTVADDKRLDSVQLDSNKTATAAHEKFITINDEDTINSDGFTLIFSARDNTPIPSIYPDQKIREQITDTIHNSHLAAIAIEKYLASSSKDYFQVTDSALILHFQNKDTIKLPKWDAKNEVGYNFDYYFPKENYYLIFKPYYEGSGWVLFNRKNGFRQDIIGTPYYSPSGNRIMSVSADFAYNPNGFELFAATKDSLVRKFRVDVANWGPASAMWLNENEIVMETVSSSGAQGYLLMKIK